MEETISYKTLIESCETGDILLYSTTYWYSKIIEYVSGSKYSHISIILKNPTYLNPKLKGVYVLESSLAEDINDINLDKKINGVQIIPIEHVFDQYRNSNIGNLYYRKLNVNRNSLFINNLKDTINNIEGDKYDINILDWIKAAFDIQIGDLHKENTFWCSAMVSYVYIKLNMLDKNIPWTIISPKKYSYYEKDSIKLINSSLDPEINIDLNN